jgi:lipopolysaccharide assembly outer membrane protein LptD (OstA)
MLAQRKNSHKISLFGIKFVPILVICLLFLNFLTSAQLKKITYADSSANSLKDTSKVLLTDSTKVNFPISKDKLESQVSYHSHDSIVYDAKAKILYLHAGAEISYEEIKVNADLIYYNQDSSTLTALEIKNAVAYSASDRIIYIYRIALQFQIKTCLGRKCLFTIW